MLYFLPARATARGHQSGVIAAGSEDLVWLESWQDSEL
jgi:hypothetical protein